MLGFGAAALLASLAAATPAKAGLVSSGDVVVLQLNYPIQAAVATAAAAADKICSLQPSVHPVFVLPAWVQHCQKHTRGGMKSSTGGLHVLSIHYT